MGESSGAGGSRQDSVVPNFLLQFGDAAELMKRELPALRWVVPGLLPEGYWVLGGRPKMGKSWLSLGLCTAVATAGQALGRFPVVAGTVLYLGLEDGEARLKARLEKLLPGQQLDPKRFSYAIQFQRLGEGAEDRLQTWAEEHQNDARLVVVDVLAKLEPPRRSFGNPYAEDYAIGSRLRGIAQRHHLCILGVTHVRKMRADDPHDAIMGTTGVVAAADGSMALDRKPGRVDAALHVRGRDLEAERKLILQFDPPTARWIFVREGSPGGSEGGSAGGSERDLSTTRSAILSVLEQSDKGLNPKDILDELQTLGHELSSGMVRKHLGKMLRAGQAHKNFTGQYFAGPLK